MLKCKRCQGYISVSTYEDFDPYCVKCVCSYPDLKKNSLNGTRKQKGLRETIRYTGNSSHMRNLLGYITYLKHPGKGSVYPMLLVECPTCTAKTEVLSSTANPATRIHGSDDRKFIRNGYRVARTSIKCSTGHIFRLKVDAEGIYSWEE